MKTARKRPSGNVVYFRSRKEARAFSPLSAPRGEAAVRILDDAQAALRALRGSKTERALFSEIANSLDDLSKENLAWRIAATAERERWLAGRVSSEPIEASREGARGA